MTALLANPSQRRAAHPEHNVWVSASAGSGKTKVLIDRILSLLLSGAQANKILCLTFTRTATAEMKQRLTQQLQHWATLDKASLTQAIAPYIYDARLSEEAARRAPKLFAEFIEGRRSVRIMTIHGFCQMILQKFSFEAGVPEGFRVLDEYQSQELLLQSQNTILMDTKNSQLQSALSFLTEHFSVNKCEEWLGNLMGLTWRHWLNHPHGHEPHLHPSLQNVIHHPRLAIAREFYEQHVRSLQKAHTILSAAGPLSKSDETKKKHLRNTLQYDSDPESFFTSARKIFLKQDGTPFEKGIFTQTLLKHYPELSELSDDLCRSYVSFWELWKLRFAYDVTQNLSQVAQALSTHYTHMKQDLCALDYDDLIDKTVRLLESSDMASWVLFKLDGGIDHILVDEAQDTSHHQWRAIHAIVQEFFGGHGQSHLTRTLFVVGDAKQSIYSFQGADPDAFFAFRNQYAEKIQASGYPWLDIPLNISYRSTQAVLDIVDETFADPKAAEGIFAKAGQTQHKAFRAHEWGKVEWWPLQEVVDGSETTDFWDTCLSSQGNRSASTRLADRIADTIHSWLQEKRMLGNHARPIRPDDIMILVQRRHEFTTALQKALMEKAIPFHGVDRVEWHEHQLFRDLVALAKAILLPEDNLALATVLKGPMFALSDADLLALRKSHDQTLWQQLLRENRYQPLVEQITKWQSWSQAYNPASLFRHILYSDSGLVSFERVYGDSTLDLCSDFLQTLENQLQDAWMSLQDFVNWALNLKREFVSHDGHTHGVRIMTVHGAKGLQAPIVILPDTMRLNTKVSPLYLWQSNNQDSLIWLPPDKQMPQELVTLREQAKQASIQESYRLLYVAMTRAEDELYVCGWDSKKSSKDGPTWHELIAKALKRKGAQVGHDGRLIFESGHVRLPLTDQHSPLPSVPSTPLWQASLKHYQPAPPIWLASPSQLGDHRAFSWEEQPSHQAQELGVTIHRLLEILPAMAQDERQSHLIKMLVRDDLRTTVTNILNNPNLQWLFAAHTYPEVPIQGYYQNLFLSATLDRVGVDAHRVWCVDYKTSSTVPDVVPDVYIRQMGAYGYLLEKLYPEKNIELYILWTQTQQLSRIDRHKAREDFEAAARRLIT